MVECVKSMIGVSLVWSASGRSSAELFNIRALITGEGRESAAPKSKSKGVESGGPGRGGGAPTSGSSAPLACSGAAEQ